MPRGRKPGEGCPLTIRLWVWGSISSPTGSRAEPRPKIDLCIFQVRKKPSGTPFSVFLSKVRGAPQTLWAPGKLPSRRAWTWYLFFCSDILAHCKSADRFSLVTSFCHPIVVLLFGCLVVDSLSSPTLGSLLE